MPILLCSRKRRDDLCLDRMCVLGLVRAQTSRKRTLVCRVTHQDNDRKGFHVLPLCKFPKSIHESWPVFFGRRHSKISRPAVPGISQSFGVGQASASGRPLHFGTREKLDEILKKGEEGGREDRRRGRGSGGGGAELAPSKEMDPFIMCTEVGEGGRKEGEAAAQPARSLLVPFDSSLGTDWEWHRGDGELSIVYTG